MKIEILHYRDPDRGCDIYVYVDGVETDPYTEIAYVNVDPGRGHDVEDWDETTEWETSPERDTHPSSLPTSSKPAPPAANPSMWRNDRHPIP